MKSINLKKIVPGIISIVIVLGMAIQSFATNVDMAAFVKKDKYMTKYYELDWRIKDIETSLNRLYKFTCTNVRTLGGAQSLGNSNINSSSAMFLLNTDASNVTPMSYQNYAELSQDKYLRFGQADLLTFSADLYDGTKLGKTIVYEIPGTFLKWRDGVELGENCTFKYTISSTQRLQSSQTLEIIIGPIKKMPAITGTGSTNGFLCQAYELICPSTFTLNFAYAVNKETKPTSWTSDSGVLYNQYYERHSSYSKIPRKLDFDSPYCRDKSTGSNSFFFNTAPSAATTLASSTNIWLKFSATYTGSPVGYYYLNVANTSNCFVVTSWNNNK